MGSLVKFENETVSAFSQNKKGSSKRGGNRKPPTTGAGGIYGSADGRFMDSSPFGLAGGDQNMQRSAGGIGQNRLPGDADASDAS